MGFEDFLNSGNFIAGFLFRFTSDTILGIVFIQ